MIDSTVGLVRSRPDLRVFYSAVPVRPGTSLVVEARFESRSRTPVELIDFALRGGETVPSAGGHFPRVSLLRRETPGVLEPGERTFRVRFDLPDDLAPTYRGVLGSVRYTFNVHVAIPWWPDLRKSFDVPVALAEIAPPPSVPQSFCTASDGGADGRLYMECAVARVAVAPDEVIEGAVSFTNVAERAVHGVVLELVARERVFGSLSPSHDVERYEVELLRGSPAEGDTLPFRLRVPARARPSFATSTFALDWGLEICARCAFGQEDARLFVPIRVVRASPRPPSARARVLPIGRERRVAVWEEVARRTGLAYDADAEVLRARDGDVTLGVHVVVGREGRRTVATYTWPDLGLDLQVGATGWLSSLVSPTRALGPSERFRVRARDAEQAAAFLDDELCAWLDRNCADVRVYDAGAEFSTNSASATVDTLERFARGAQWALAAFARGAAAIRVPAAVAEHEAAWRAFAARAGGRFEPGRVRVIGGKAGVDRFDAGLEWSDAKTVKSTFARVALDPPLAAPPSPEDPSLSPAARELLRAVRAELAAIVLGTAAFEWREPGLVADPAEKLEARVALVARLARAARGLEGHGPFR